MNAASTVPTARTVLPKIWDRFLNSLPLFALTPSTQQLRRPDLPLFGVAHVSPSMNALNVPRSTSIAVTFNLPVDSASLANAHQELQLEGAGESPAGVFVGEQLNRGEQRKP